MSLDEPIDDKPMPRELSKGQRRVLGVLIEKGMTTPEYYPMTLKAVVSGANQKSNRSPVTHYSEDQVQEFLDELRDLGLIAVVHTQSGRTERYRHYMRKKRIKISEPQLAILAELMLRGRQQMGELRARASRMVAIDDQDALRTELQGLIDLQLAHSSGPLERRGIEVDHCLYPDREQQAWSEMSAAAMDEEPGAVAAPSTAARASTATANSEMAQLQGIVGEQQATIEDLQLQVRELRETCERLSDDLQELKQQLGV